MLVLHTYDWVPDVPRGFVRDLRVRWVLEELGRPYRVETVPIGPKSAAHRAMQPFAQVPVIRDGGLTLFESGAIALHLAEGTPLLPEARRAEVMQWLIAALNSVETVTGRWIGMVLAARWPDTFGPPSPPGVVEHARRAMADRLAALEPCLTGRDWLAGGFSVADVLMADVLRLPASEGELARHPVLSGYLARAIARPAFRKAMADHMAHWQAADAARKAPEEDAT